MTRVRPPLGRGARQWALGLPLAALALALGVRGVGSAPDSDSAASGPDTAITASVELPPPGQHETLPAVEHPFKVGESLKFSVQYGFIHAGSAWLEVPDKRDWHGHSVYRLVARAESNGFFSAFYKVRNRIESYWDATGRYSWRYTEDRHEGHYRFKGEIKFDPERHQAVYDNGLTLQTPPRVQDALSSFYYTRFQALPIGGSVVFDYHASRKSAPLQVKVVGREKIETPAGTFNCIAIEPALQAGGIFKNAGRLVVWITDDQRRMPVLMKSKLTIGSISVILVDIKGAAG
jgi:hypothetical protein